MRARSPTASASHFAAASSIPFADVPRRTARVSEGVGPGGVLPSGTLICGATGRSSRRSGEAASFALSRFSAGVIKRGPGRAGNTAEAERLGTGALA